MKKQVALFSLCTLALATSSSFARETILSGGVDLGIEFNDQTSTAEETAQDQQVTPAGEASAQEVATVDLADEDDDFSRIVVSPSIKIATSTARTEFEAEYHPQLNYDDDGDSSINQALSSSANWAVSRAWQVSVADDYAETDDPGSTESLFAAEEDGTAGDEAAAGSSRETESQLSDVGGRHQVTTNTATIETSYSYWEDSSANLGYAYEILRNDDDDTVYQDFDRHDIFAGAVHRLNSDYRISVKGDYVIGEVEEQLDDQTALASEQSDPVVSADGLEDTADPVADEAAVAVDQSEDLVEYHLATVLDILTLPNHPLSVEYDLALTDYEAESRGDVEIHTAMLGWGWEVNDKLSLSLGAGPTYQRRDGGEDSWDYAVRFDIDYQLEKSRFQLSGGSGTEVRNFTGTDDNALTTYWEARAVYSRDLLDTLDMFIFAAYNHDDRETLELTSASAVTDTTSAGSDSADGSTLNLSTSTVTEKIALGGGLTYSFWQWYSAKLSYTFTTQEGDEAEDQYDEHRVMLQLSMHRDFLKW